MSTSYLALRDNLGRTMARFFDETQAAERSRTAEATAARLIQRWWRAYNARTYIRYLSEQATQVQRIWRGFVARKRCDDLQIEQNEREADMYYAAFAILIQKRWRGYRSRKEREDFYKRAQWVHKVTEQSRILSKTSDEYAAAQYEIIREQKQEQAAQQFESLAGNLHHLVSTQSVPGIFKSKFGAEYERTAYEVPMDQHLWGAFRNTNALRNATKTRELPSMAGTKKSLPQVRTGTPKSLSKSTKSLSKSTRVLRKTQGSHKQFQATGKHSRHRPQELPPARYPTKPKEEATPPKLGNSRYLSRRAKAATKVDTQHAKTGAARRFER